MAELKSPYQARPTEPPNAWWREFDAALSYALSLKWSAKKAEDFALERAEGACPGGRDAVE
jgi:hypothetical protein